MHRPLLFPPPVHTSEVIGLSRECARIGRAALDVGHRAVGVRVTTEEIDRPVNEYYIS